MIVVAVVMGGGGWWWCEVQHLHSHSHAFTFNTHLPLHVRTHRHFARSPLASVSSAVWSQEVRSGLAPPTCCSAPTRREGSHQ